MLDTKYLIANKRNPFKYFFFGVLATLNFLIFMLVLINDFYLTNEYCNDYSNVFILFNREDIFIEIEALGQLLYTHFVFHFLVAGLILFLSVLGVVALSTVSFSEKNLSRDIRQVSRTDKL